MSAGEAADDGPGAVGYYMSASFTVTSAVEFPPTGVDDGTSDPVVTPCPIACRMEGNVPVLVLAEGKACVRLPSRDPSHRSAREERANAAVAQRESGSLGSHGGEATSSQPVAGGKLVVMDTWWALSVLQAEPKLSRFITLTLQQLCAGDAGGGEGMAAGHASVEVRVDNWPLPRDNGSPLLEAAGLDVKQRRDPVADAAFLILARAGEKNPRATESMDSARSLDAVYDTLRPAEPVVATSQELGRGLLRLPSELLLGIMRWLQAPDIRALGSTCRRLHSLTRSMCMSVLPGLHLPPLPATASRGETAGCLLPHQRGVVEWMVRREGGMTCGSASHTTFKDHPSYLLLRARSVLDQQPTDVYVDRWRMTVGTRAETLRLGTGGCLSDRPGMGKTVSALALCMWKLGSLSRDRKLPGSEDTRRWWAADDAWTRLPSFEREQQCIALVRKGVGSLIASSMDHEAFKDIKFYAGIFNDPVDTEFFCDYKEKVPPGKHELCINTIIRTCYPTLTAMYDDVMQMFVNAVRMPVSAPAEPRPPARRTPLSQRRPTAPAMVVPGPRSLLLTSLAAASQTLYNHPSDPLHGFAAFMVRSNKVFQLFNKTAAALAGSGFLEAEKEQNLLRTQASLVVVPPHMLSHWVAKARQMVGRDGVLPNPRDRAGPPLRMYVHSRGSNVSAATLAASHWLVVVPMDYFQDRLALDGALGKVSWNRLFVDEGDNMAAAGLSRSRMALLNLHVDHRWVITGTPTPQFGGQSGLSNLRRLLQFIREPPFDGCGGTWPLRVIQRPFENNARADVILLLQKILARAMVIHSPASVIPPPIYTTVSIDLTASEKRSYNTFAGMALCNIVLNLLCVSVHKSSPEPYRMDRDRAWAQCYLNPAAYRIKVKEGSEGSKATMSKLLRSTANGQDARFRLDYRDVQQSMVLLAGWGFCDVEAKERVRRYWRQVGDAEQTERCDTCARGTAVVYLLATPCGHLVCPSCVLAHVGGLDRITDSGAFMPCPVSRCPKTFATSAFTELQPGVAARWARTEALDQRRFWFRDLQAQKRFAKESFVVDRLSSWDKAGKAYKAIVFSQFREGLYLLGDRLARHRTEALRSKPVRALDEYARATATPAGEEAFLAHADYQHVSQNVRDAEMERFCSTDFCNVLLLGASHVEGLDLSLVTHIFVMEFVQEPDMWTQLVARASRIGARSGVQVIRLSARGTIEEHLAALSADSVLTAQQRCLRIMRNIRTIDAADDEPAPSTSASAADSSPASRQPRTQRRVHFASPATETPPGGSALPLTP